MALGMMFSVLGNMLDDAEWAQLVRFCSVQHAYLKAFVNVFHSCYVSCSILHA